jgi:hypothetical protein
MSVAGKRAFAGLSLLLLAWWGYWWLSLQPHRDSRPTLEQLVAELRLEEPWYYHLLKRSNTLRFLPQRWFSRYSAPDLAYKKFGALMELGRLGTNAWPAVPALVAMVKHKNLEIACSAAQALAFVKADQDPEWSRLQRDLNGQSSAARAFGWLLAGRNPQFGLIGLAATGSAGVIAHGRILELFKSSQETELRGYAVTALGAMSASINTVPMLKNVLQNQEEWPTVSAAAAQALATAAPGEPETRRLLQQALQERRSHVRLAAARALWRLQAPAEEVLPVLTALLHHKLATVRRGALDLLAEMGGTARNSQTEVEPLLDDENEMVRRSARAAWKSITGGAASNSKKANFPAGGNAGSALQSEIGSQWPGVPQPGCSAQSC